MGLVEAATVEAYYRIHPTAYNYSAGDQAAVSDSELTKNHTSKQQEQACPEECRRLYLVGVGAARMLICHDNVPQVSFMT